MNQFFSPHYQFALHVTYPDGKCIAAQLNLDAFAAHQFEPIDVCDTGIVAMATGGHTSFSSQPIKREREALAKELARRLTTSIMDAIESRDLKNGYEK